jgi:AhpD family alkylhydroperoxidase
MNRNGETLLRSGRLAALAATHAHAATATSAAGPDASADATNAEIEATLGTVPTFVKLFPKAAVAGAWAEARNLEFSDDTALSPKVKSLISLAVSAQIPCHYCVWSDTKAARDAGATDEEIAEAVAMAALTRHWSTFLNGMAVDFDQYKAELGGE